MAMDTVRTCQWHPEIVCIAFGLFFVFAIKQAPDLKMRNFRKSAKKTIDPVVLIGKRLSSSSSKQPRDVLVDATDEDLPEDWVKKRRVDGTFYYFNVLTGDWQSSSPNDGPSDPDAGGIAAAHQPEVHGGIPAGTVRERAVVQRHTHAIASIFKRNHSRNDEMLPPGWVARTDSDGRTYYVDTVRKTSQWDRPPHIRSRTKMKFPSRKVIAVVDMPMSRHASGRWRASSSLRPKSKRRGSEPPLPPRNTPATSSAYRSGVGAKETEDLGDLPPGWEMKHTDTGRAFYVNQVLRTTQWERP